MPTSARIATVKRIQELYNKLTKEALVSDELEELVKLTSDLHESAIVLRYKAAEERVFEDKKPIEVEAPKKQTKPEAPAVEEKIDFSIFEEVQEKASDVLDFDNKKELVVEEVKEEKPTTPVSENEWTSYFDQVLKEHSSGLQTPLSSLAGSFGLNERILYINELFSKESDAFSETIQKLDGLSDWNSCVNELANLASGRNWDRDSDTTGEFIIHVKRKYA